MKTFVKSNLVDADVTEFMDFQTMLGQVKPVPKNIKSKADLKTWLSEDSTNHHLYSMAAGLDPQQIISPNNPVREIHGFIADFDSNKSMADIQKSIDQFIPEDLRPTHVVESFSGNFHLIFEFDYPVGIADADEYKAIAKVFAANTNLNKISPKWDSSAFEKPSMFYTYGRGHANVPKSKAISQNSIQTIRYELSGEGFYEDRGIVVPMTDVKAEMDKRFPNHGYRKVAEGQRGRRFWDPSAKDATAAVLCTTGVLYFSNMGGFKTWSEIFGESFVRKYRVNTVGNALATIYYDGSKFWRRANNNWTCDAMEPTKIVLKTQYNFSASKKVKGKNYTELEEVLSSIINLNRVDGAFPFVHNPRSIVNYSGYQFVNTARVKCMQPVDAKIKHWGDKFPQMAAWLDHFFVDKHQKEVFLTWLHLYYKGALRGEPGRGQAMFIVGGVHIGKSLLLFRVLDPLMGGSSDATRVLTRGANFNKDLFNTGISYVDDATGFVDHKGRKLFSETVKKLVASPEMEYEAKFKDAVKLPFHSRIVVNMNDDPSSMELLPTISGSVQDKIIMLRGNRTPYAGFPPGMGMQRIISQELPFFARWLYEWNPPASCLGNGRFNVISFIDPELQQDAMMGDEETMVRDLIERFREEYFKSVEGNSLDYQDFSASNLPAQLMEMDPDVERLFRDRSSNLRLQRILKSLDLHHGGPWGWFERIRIRGSGFGYRIHHKEPKR